jgi:hypothetical protein
VKIVGERREERVVQDKFTMSLDEALRRSPEGTAYALVHDEEIGRFVYCSKDGIPHFGCGFDWDGDPASIKWRPTGGEKRWLPDVQSVFFSLAGKWEVESAGISSDSRFTKLSYQQIIGLGPDVVPFLLRDLVDNSDDPPHWFWALVAITRANPMPDSARGDSVQQANAWIRWGLSRGIIQLEKGESDGLVL